MFGVTAKQWRETNPDLKGNIRDYATINELICLSNMENLNAVFIEQGITQGERLVKLNQIAIHQMSVLESGDNDRKLLKYWVWIVTTKLYNKWRMTFFRLWDFSRKGNRGLGCMIVAIALFKLNFSHLHILVAHSVMSE